MVGHGRRGDSRAFGFPRDLGGATGTLSFVQIWDEKIANIRLGAHLGLAGAGLL